MLAVHLSSLLVPSALIAGAWLSTAGDGAWGRRASPALTLPVPPSLSSGPT